MKLKAFVKLTVVSTIKNLSRLLLVFSVFPVFLGLLLGYFQTEQFTPAVDIPIMNVKIVDEDNTIQSKNLVGFLNSKEMKKIIEIDEEEAKYELLIPKGYEESLLNNRESNIRINVEKKGSIKRGTILGDIIDRYNEEISQGLYIGNKIDGMDIPQEEKDKLVKTIGEEMANSYNTTGIKNFFINTKKSLTSYEYFSITFLSYMLILVIMSLVTSGDAERDDMLYYRIMSTPITKIQYFNYNQVSAYLLVLFMNLLYIFTYRILGLSFQGSLPILILIVLVQAVMITALSGFVMVFLKKKHAMMLLNVLMMSQLILRVTYISIENMDIQFLKALATKYSPDILIVNTYRNYLIFNDLNTIKFNLILMILVSIGLHIVSLLRLKWGGNYENSKA